MVVGSSLTGLRGYVVDSSYRLGEELQHQLYSAAAMFFELHVTSMLKRRLAPMDTNKIFLYTRCYDVLMYKNSR